MPPTSSPPAYPRLRTRLLQVFISVVTCFLAGGIVFGYAALKPVLIAEDVYRDLCTPEEIEKGVTVCEGQELRLNVMFTCAAVATNCAAFPVGYILDHKGPRFASVLGCVFLAIGGLFMAFARGMHIDGYLWGYLSLALGGPLVFIPSFQLSNAFPANAGLVLSALTGAFDASSALFLAYRLIYTSTEGAIGPEHFFLGYLLVPVFIFITQVTIMPKHSYQTLSEMVKKVENRTGIEEDLDGDTLDEGEVRTRRLQRRESALSEVSALLGPKVMTKKKKREDEARSISGVWGALHGMSPMEQIMTPWWGLITIFAILQMLRINYFVATIRPQYTYLFGDETKAIQINEFFDIALPLGGVLAVPFIGGVLDRTSTTMVTALLTAMTTLIGVLGIMPYMWAAYGNVILFVVYRPFYYTAVSDYGAKVFGFVTFGTVYGLTNSISGAFNLIQAALDNLTHTYFENDPIPVNVGLLSLGIVIGLALVLYVTRQSRRMRANRGRLPERISVILEGDE